MSKIKNVAVKDPFAPASIVLQCTKCAHVSQYDPKATKKTEKPCPMCKGGILVWDGKQRAKNKELKFEYKPDMPKNVNKKNDKTQNKKSNKKKVVSPKSKPNKPMPKAPNKKLPPKKGGIFKALPKVPNKKKK